MSIHEVFPYLCVRGAAKAIDFYVQAFGAREKFRLTEPSGRIGHAELEFGGATVMLADEFPEYGTVGPETIGGSGVTIHLHVDDADAVIASAVAGGAQVQMAAQDQFYGERSGRIRDPFGHSWNIGHSIEAMTPDEMQRRYTEMLKGA